MAKTHEHPESVYKAGDTVDGLQQALLRLTHPHYADLKADLQNLDDRIAALGAARVALESAAATQTVEIETLSQQAENLQELIGSIQGSIADLSSALKEFETLVRAEVAIEIKQVDRGLSVVKHDLESDHAMSARLRPVLVPAIHDRVREESGQVAAAISPVIGPAIRHQIRSARQDIIDALYPVIGNIISRAISEELRTLSRKIDGQLRQQLNFQKRMSNQLARLRGVSDGELLLRDALPFSLEHVFLIHQETGLLLAHQQTAGEVTADPDLIGGMMTAIGDFVKDSFGKGESNLEEISYGEKRILLEAAQYAYVAVVLEGIEPAGYNHLVRAVINEIHLKAEDELREFDGEMLNLPNFQGDLRGLLDPDPETLAMHASPEDLEQSQRLFVFGASLAFLILIVGISFACLYAVRLWPLVFP
jgi:hypothetical protein